MPQEFYTLDQAAKRLGLPEDKVKEMANKREVRAFFDRGTQRFRKQEIDELARQRGMASDVELQLGDSSQHSAPAAGQGSDVFPFELGGAESELGMTEVFAPAPKSPAGSDSDVRLVPEGSDLELKAQPQPSKPPSSGRLGQSKKGNKPDSDSDVKLVDESIGIGDENLAGGSRVRLDSPSGKGLGKDSGARLVDDMPTSKSGRRAADISSPTEEIDLDAELRKMEASRSGAQGKGHTVPFETPKAPKTPAPPKGKVAKETDSSSDFDFNLPGEDSSAEQVILGMDSGVNLGDMSKASGTSGINLDQPSDRGFPLEDLNDSSEESLTFELEGEPSAPSTPKPAKVGHQADSSSEFELTLDDEGGLAPLEQDRSSDPVVRTNVSLPLQDSGSEELTLEGGSSSDMDLETSDFELALDDEGAPSEGSESGSEVIVIDEGAEESDATAVRPQALDALEGEEVEELFDEPEVLTEVDADDENLVGAGTRPSMQAAPAEWGLWSILLIPTTLAMMFTGFLLWEQLRAQSAFGQPTPVGSKVFDMFSNMMK